MDSRQFVYTVINEALGREIDRKINLENKVMSLFRLWVFLITAFITVITFLISYNSDVIRSLINLNNHWTCILIFITCATAFTLLSLLYLIVSIASISFGISDKSAIQFESTKIDSMLDFEINPLYSDVCKTLNYSIEDYRKRNKDISDSIKKSLPLINVLIITLYAMLLLFTLIMIVS